jgi:anti-anti-sigma regulatory factor
MTSLAALEGRIPTDGAPAPPDLAISLTFANDRAVVSVRGELDSLTADAFGSFVESATAQPGCVVVIDFAELTHLGRFDQVARVLAGASPMIRKVLELTGHSEVLNADRLVPTGPERVPNNVGSLEPEMWRSRFRPSGRAVTGGRD